MILLLLEHGARACFLLCLSMTSILQNPLLSQWCLGKLNSLLKHGFLIWSSSVQVWWCSGMVFSLLEQGFKVAHYSDFARAYKFFCSGNILPNVNFCSGPDDARASSMVCSSMVLGQDLFSARARFFIVGILTDTRHCSGKLSFLLGQDSS